MSGTGSRAGWMSPYLGDRPRDILGLTQAQEAKIAGYIGFQGKEQDGSDIQQFIGIYTGTSGPTLTDFASTPVGFILISPFLTHSLIHVHKSKSSPAVIGDWEVFTAATVT